MSAALVIVFGVVCIVTAPLVGRSLSGRMSGDRQASYRKYQTGSTVILGIVAIVAGVLVLAH
jgi:drug/metabolite transporter (DMT)-like permease